MCLCSRVGRVGYWHDGYRGHSGHCILRSMVEGLSDLWGILANVVPEHLLMDLLSVT